MPAKILIFLRRHKQLAFPALTCAAAAAVALSGILSSGLSGKEGALVVWIWAAVLAWDYLRRLSRVENPTTAKNIHCLVGWGMLGIAVVMKVYSFPELSWFFLTGGLLCYFSDFRRFGVCAVPLFLWLTVLPALPYCNFMLSYPMRLVGTYLTLFIMQLGGMAVSGSGTMIYIGEQGVAITAACSGIEQLEAMLLVGWLIAMWSHQKTLTRLMHFSMILPLIIFFNVLRLLATLLGFRYFGEVALGDAFHTWMGLAMVLAVALGFIGLRGLFEVTSTEDANE